MKVLIYFGPKNEFEKHIPDENALTLVDLALKCDENRRTHKFKIEGKELEEKEEIEHYNNVVAYSDSYAAINEATIQSFVSFIYEFEIDNLFLQNPPEYIVQQINSLKDISVDKESFAYKTLTIDILKRIKTGINDKIIGQENALRELIGSLYPLAKGRYKKPCVLLLYGNTGVGKTETAKYLSECLNQKLFRKQFSMFHSEDFASYLFGGKHSQNCFAKELLERESNIILLDEFDKPAPVFHSAFYQLFDEGVFEDKNYKVEMRDSIIICTSNYLSLKDIREKLGDPIYSRFDAVIKYTNLDIEAVKVLISREFQRQYDELDDQEIKIIESEKCLEKILSYAPNLTNAREIKRVVREAITAKLIDGLL